MTYRRYKIRFDNELGIGHIYTPSGEYVCSVKGGLETFGKTIDEHIADAK